MTFKMGTQEAATPGATEISPADSQPKHKSVESKKAGFSDIDPEATEGDPKMLEADLRVGGVAKIEGVAAVWGKPGKSLLYFA
jgi:hypothetical protein